MEFYLPGNVVDLLETLYTPLVDCSSLGADVVSRAELASITATYDSLLDAVSFGQPLTGFTLWSACNLCEYLLSIWRALYSCDSWVLNEDPETFLANAYKVLDEFAEQLEPLPKTV